MFMQIIVALSWLALPVALLCVVDDWFLRPRRQIAAASQPVRDPPLVAFAYHALPVLVCAAVLRLLVAERLDFALVLSLITILTGIIWWLDVAILRPRRAAAARAQGQDPTLIPEPATVDYARSFFPVALVVLLLRSFIFEPFRIPSDSMMPTLFDGDFIIVNKSIYGLRWPVFNRKFLTIQSPQRGDVVVFRYPLDPSINYIKRLVGLPGDRIQMKDGLLYINEKPVTRERLSDFIGEDPCGSDATARVKRWKETLPNGVSYESLDCVDNGFYDNTNVYTIPPGHFFMMGDNRDNSTDSRVLSAVGYVPFENIVGRAQMIFFSIAEGEHAWMFWRWPTAVRWNRLFSIVR